MRHRANFVQSDVARAIRGAIKGGGSPSRVEIDRAGKIVVFLGDAPAASNADDLGDMDAFKARLDEAGKAWQR
jgi:hypothetical protein